MFKGRYLSKFALSTFELYWQIKKQTKTSENLLMLSTPMLKELFRDCH